MISTLRGEITQIDDTALVVEVGGIGLRVQVPAPVRAGAKPGEPAFLYTYLVVREDSLALYGFETPADRELFKLLLGVDGVGPRIALAVLSTYGRDDIQRAILTGQAELLSKVPGVGSKTAQKIALHLRDKLKATGGISPSMRVSEQDAEVLAALTALGYSVVEAQAAIQSLPHDAPSSAEERLRLALQSFS